VVLQVISVNVVALGDPQQQADHFTTAGECRLKFATLPNNFWA
jgi:hypothetical protein